MNTRLGFRRAHAGDRSSILSLVKTYPDKLMQTDVPKSSAFFVATVGSYVVGCCALIVYSKRLAEIRSLAVSKEHQGKGIATKLILLCLKDARKRNVHEVITITGARSLFERFGFGAFKNEKYALLNVLARRSATTDRG